MSETMKPGAVALDRARDAVVVAQAASPAWAATGPHARRAVLLRVADELEAMADEFVAAMREETGSTEPWARFNVGSRRRCCGRPPR